MYFAKSNDKDKKWSSLEIKCLNSGFDVHAVSTVILSLLAGGPVDLPCARLSKRTDRLN